MISLEGVYNVRIIKGKVNLIINYEIKREKSNNKTARKVVIGSVIEKIENQMVDDSKNNKKFKVKLRNKEKMMR